MTKTQTTNETASLAVTAAVLYVLIGAGVGFLGGPRWLPNTRLSDLIVRWLQQILYPDPVQVVNWEAFGRSMGLVLGLLAGLLAGLIAALVIVFRLRGADEGLP